MGSVKMFLKLGVCTVCLMSMALVYGIHDASAKGWKKGGSKQERTRVIELWSKGEPAFCVFAGGTEEDFESLAQRDLDCVFLDWEHDGYDIELLTKLSAALDSGDREISFVVRIPPLGENIEDLEPIELDTAKQYVAEILSVKGVDGVVFPFISGAEMARQAVSCFTEAGADVWSPQNPRGKVISWLMLEDTAALAEVEEVANTPGISVLVTGTGTLSGETGQDGTAIGAEGAELGKQLVLAHSTRVGVANVSLAIAFGGVADPVIEQLDQGFPGMLVIAPTPELVDEYIQEGREYFAEMERDYKEEKILKRQIALWWKRLLRSYN